MEDKKVKLKQGVTGLLDNLYPKSTGYVLVYINDDGFVEMSIAAKNKVAAEIFGTIGQIVIEELNKIGKESKKG